MIDLGPHAGFILGAYGGVAAAVLGLIVYVVFDRGDVEGRIARLEQQGMRRRAESERL